MNILGISLYLSSGLKKNKEVILKARNANMSYAFTSLHIPEEEILDYTKEVTSLLSICKENNLDVFVDISPHTLEKLNLTTFSELQSLGITHIRLDFGFSIKEMIALSKDFYIVLNASTFLPEDAQKFKSYGADFSKFIACHNFYPQPYTGLSVSKVKEINDRLHSYGMSVMGFVAGNQELRGPLFQGLPTIESHRQGDVIANLQELKIATNTDILLIGDIDIEPTTWDELKLFQQNIIPLSCNLDEEFKYFYHQIQQDRPDSSDYLIRTEASRTLLKPSFQIEAKNCGNRHLGDVAIANQNFLRYQGELTIARKSIPADSRVNLIGKVQDHHLARLAYLMDGTRLILLPPSDK